MGHEPVPRRDAPHLIGPHLIGPRLISPRLIDLGPMVRGRMVLAPPAARARRRARGGARGGLPARLLPFRFRP